MGDWISYHSLLLQLPRYSSTLLFLCRPRHFHLERSQLQSPTQLLNLIQTPESLSDTQSSPSHPEVTPHSLMVCKPKKFSSTFTRIYMQNNCYRRNNHITTIHNHDKLAVVVYNHNKIHAKLGILVCTCSFSSSRG